MAMKLLGALLLIAGLILRYLYVRGRQRGYLGSKRRRLTRAQHRGRFQLALAGHALGALICFIAAFICLTGSIHFVR